MTRQEQVAWVRRALLALGGWNARSRGVLQAWAASQRIGAAELESLVTQAVGAARRPPPPARSAAELPAKRRRANARWWAAAGALAGLVVSALLVQRLVERWPRPASPRPPRLETRNAPDEPPARTLPPVPVPFPVPPDVVASSGGAAVGAVLFPGPRPQGEATAGEVRAWAEALDSLLVTWPDRDAPSVQRAVDELATWLAASPSRRDLDRLRERMDAEVHRHPEPAARMLADAFVAMLLDQAARSEAITSTAAEALGARTEGPDALQAWAAGQIPALQALLQKPEGRVPWAAWLRAVSRMPKARARVQVALQAIDAVLRSGARLDGQGLPADVAGSLLEGLPVEPSQAGFDLVREAWQAWLRDGSVDARSLWALGGVWRALPASPDPQLLPGERDGMRQREQVADAWQALPVTPAAPAWQPLQARLAEIESGSPQDAPGWISRLADLVDLVRMLHAARRGQDPSRMAPAAAAPEPPAPAPVVPADRWKSRLAEASRAPRLLALEQMQGSEVAELGWGDAERLTAMAIGGRDRRERELALELLRGPLAATPSARRGLLLQAATVEDLRKAVEVLEIACERAVPGADPASLRQQVLAALLALEPTGAAATTLQAPLARLRAACALWAQAEGVQASDKDPALSLWAIALHRGRQANAVATPAAFRADLEGAPDRVRRLQRVAGSGPRGMAAAALAMVVWQSAWLSAERPDLAPALLDMLRSARGQAQSVDQAVPQACVAVGWLARMELFRLGAPAPRLPAASPMAQAPEWLLQAAETAGQTRAGLLERVWVAGAGAMLPEPRERQVAEGLLLVQALAWCHQGQVERLARQAVEDPGRALTQRMAAARGQELAPWGTWLTQLPEAERWEALAPLRLAAAEALLPSQAAWPRAAVEPAPAVPAP